MHSLFRALGRFAFALLVSTAHCWDRLPCRKASSLVRAILF